MPRVEQDFLINLNALNTLYKGAVAAKDEAFANRIENLMDVATVAIMLYENTDNGVVDVEKGISCLRVMYDEGAFNQPVGTTNDQRSQVMNIILGAVIQQSPSVTANEDDIDYLLEVTGISTPGFDAKKYLGSDVAVGKTSYRQMRSSSLSGISITQDQINSIQKTLEESAEYFMYSFIPDSKIGEYPAAVKNKRAYYKSVYQDIKKSGAMPESECLRIINNAIASRYPGCDGELFLYKVKTGEIPVIGWIAVVSAILSALAAIARVFNVIFGDSEEETNEKFKINAPSTKDGFSGIVPDADDIIFPDTGSGSTDNPLLEYNKPTGTVAGSNFLGILLVGGVLMALIFGGSGDKKKKKK